MKFSAEHSATLKIAILAYFKTLGMLPAALRQDPAFAGNSESYFQNECYWASRNSHSAYSLMRQDEYTDAHRQTALKAVFADLEAHPEVFAAPLEFTEENITHVLTGYTKVLPLTLSHVKAGGFVYTLEEGRWHDLPSVKQWQELADLFARLFDCTTETTQNFQLKFLAGHTAPYGGWTIIDKEVVSGPRRPNAIQAPETETKPREVFAG